MKPRTEGLSAVRLEALRRQKNLSQRELARLTNISQAQVAELERGKRQPTVEVAERIAGALGVNLGDLSLPEELGRKTTS